MALFGSPLIGSAITAAGIRTRPKPVTVQSPTGPTVAVPPPTNTAIPTGTQLAAPVPMPTPRPAPVNYTPYGGLNNQPTLGLNPPQPSQPRTAPAPGSPLIGAATTALNPPPAPAAPVPSPVRAPMPAVTQAAGGGTTLTPPVPSVLKMAPPVGAPAPGTGTLTMDGVITEMARNFQPPQPNILPPKPGVTGAAAAPPPIPPGTQAITGDEGYYRVNPERDAGMQQLLDRLVTESNRGLDQPTVYDDDLFKQSLELGRQSLDADLARRGITQSTAGSELFSTRVLNPLLRERAQALSSGREAATRNAMATALARQNVGTAERAEQRGERGYLDELRGRARAESIEDLNLEEAAGARRESEFQSLLNQALGAGFGSAPLSGFGSAAYGYGDVGGDLNSQLQALLQQIFGQSGQSTNPNKTG